MVSGATPELLCQSGAKGASSEGKIGWAAPEQLWQLWATPEQLRLAPTNSPFVLWLGSAAHLILPSELSTLAEQLRSGSANQKFYNVKWSTRKSTAGDIKSFIMQNFFLIWRKLFLTYYEKLKK